MKRCPTRAASNRHCPRLARACRRGLAKQPEQRFANAREFLAELEDAARQRYGAAWMSGLGLGSLVGGIVATRTGTSAPPAPSPPKSIRRGIRRPRGRVVAAGGVGVALVAIAIGLITSRPSPPSQPSARARSIEYAVRQGPGLLSFGLVDPNGSGAHLVPLPLDRLCCFAESLSPDGRRLALTEEGSLFVVSVDGTNERVIRTWPSVSPGAVAWSPDGTRIAFSTGSALDVITTDGTGLHRLATGSDITALAWSPAGNRLAFLEKGQPEIRAVALTGGPVSTLYGAPPTSASRLTSNPTSLAWAPGSSILFGTSGPKAVWSYSVGAARATRVLGGADQPTWGPDGRSFAAIVGKRIVIDVPGKPHRPPIGPSGVLTISW